MSDLTDERLAENRIAVRCMRMWLDNYTFDRTQSATRLCCTMAEEALAHTDALTARVAKLEAALGEIRNYRWALGEPMNGRDLQDIATKALTGVVAHQYNKESLEDEDDV